MRWAAGVGSLEWYASSDGWTPIARAATRRRDWTAGDAFLVPGWTTVAPGLEIADLPVRRPPNPLATTLFLARVDPAAWRFRVWGGPAFDPASGSSGSPPTDPVDGPTNGPTNSPAVSRVSPPRRETVFPATVAAGTAHSTPSSPV